MRRWNPSAEDGDADRGSAPLEFLTLGLLLLVPLIYLVIALGTVQGQALGVESGARHLARVIATSPPQELEQRASTVISSVAREYGIDADDLEVSWDCSPQTRECPAPGAIVKVTLRTSATLPLAPPVLGLDDIASVPVEATSAQKVSRYGADR